MRKFDFLLFLLGFFISFPAIAMHGDSERHKAAQKRARSSSPVLSNKDARKENNFAQRVMNKASDFVTDFLPRQSENSQIQEVAQTMLIFFDDSEYVESMRQSYDGSSKKYLAVVSTLLSALITAEAPILTHSSLLMHLFSQYKNDDKNVTCNFLSNAYSQLIKKDQSYIFQLLSSLGVNPEKWIIKIVDESKSLCLLLPNTYLQKCGVSADMVNAECADVLGRETSDVERMLGLKVNHMKSITMDDLLAQEPELEAMFIEDYTMESGHLMHKQIQDNNVLDSIFCTYHHYQGTTRYAMKSWIFVLTGHGDGLRIAAMRFDTFKIFLDFLTRQITTRLLIYNSCYAAGTNNKKIYEVGSVLHKAYLFPIITMALTEAPTIAAWTCSFFPFVRFSHGANYKEFLEKIKTIDYSQKCMNSLAGIISCSSLLSFPNDTPQIRLPHTEWFSVIANRDEVVSVGSTLAMSRSVDKPLRMSTFFGKKHHMVLLYARNIPFEIIVDAPGIRSIIPMIPGETVYVLEKISCPHLVLQRILKCFMRLEKLMTTKLFFIKHMHALCNYDYIKQHILNKSRSKLTCRNTQKVSAEWFLSLTSVHDVIIFYDAHQRNPHWIAFCTTAHGTKLCFTPQHGVQVATQEQQQQYERMLADVKQQTVTYQPGDSLLPLSITPETMDHLKCMAKNGR